ncbi:MAG: glycosyltransferase [Ignavibacteriales bacterium]|nr:glycosyltransferase [Ignavibacteriales bacterium]
MKIVQTNKAYYPKVGGIETTIRTLSEGFVKDYGANVDVLACNHTRYFKKIDKTINGVNVSYMATLGFFSSLPISPGYFQALLKLKGDILHIHQPFPLADLTLEFFPQLKKNFSKIITSWHCDITRQKWALPIYGKYIHRFLKSVDKITVSNPNLVENSDFLPSYKDKCVVIPHGINLGWANSGVEINYFSENPTLNYNNKIILFVGRLVIYKGVEYLIEAMQYVSNASLIIIGSGPLEKNLLNRISILKLNSRISIIPEVDDKTLQHYYKSCDLFVLPSINKTEAYGLVQIEAMACGKPVICTNLATGTTFINQHRKTGLVVPPKNSKALADSINKLISDKSLRDSLGSNAKNRAISEFTSEKMVKRTYDLYLELLKDSL